MRNIIDELIDDLGDAIDENQSDIPRAVPTQPVDYSYLLGIYVEDGRLIINGKRIADHMAISSVPEGEADIYFEGFGNIYVVWNHHNLTINFPPPVHIHGRGVEGRS